MSGTLTAVEAERENESKPLDATVLVFFTVGL